VVLGLPLGLLRVKTTVYPLEPNVQVRGRLVLETSWDPAPLQLQRAPRRSRTREMYI
jgi:hypothetical protein